jgi:hypothetical protein
MIGDGDCGEIGGIKIGRGNRSTRRKPAPAPICPLSISFFYGCEVTGIRIKNVYHN